MAWRKVTLDSVLKDEVVYDHPLSAGEVLSLLRSLRAIRLVCNSSAGKCMMIDNTIKVVKEYAQQHVVDNTIEE